MTTTTQMILAWGSGVVFLLLLFGIAAYSVQTGKEIVGGAMLLLRIIIAATGAAFVAVIPGFLNVQTAFPMTTIQTGGGLAAFVLLLFFNPPEHLSRAAAKPGPIVIRKVPGRAIEDDLPKRKRKT